MPFFLHSSLKISTAYFEAPVEARLEALMGGEEVRERAMLAHPYGVVSTYIGVGGVMTEQSRHRGFCGPLPKMANLMAPEHAEKYRDKLFVIGNLWREDQALAAACGSMAGILVGMGAMGIASFFTTNLSIVSIPFAVALPGATLFWALELHRMKVRQARLQSVLIMAEGIERPFVPEVWQRAVKEAKRQGFTRDKFLRDVAGQFVTAKDNILPRYDDLGIYLPTYYPPDENSSANGYQPVAADEIGANP